METKTTIYALCESNGEIRYIGKSVNLPRRIKHHLSDAKRGTPLYVSRWIRTLLDDGKKPLVKVLEQCSGDGCAEEKWHIANARSKGVRLTNLTEGGEGTSGPLMSLLKKMAYNNPEFRRKQSLRMMGIGKGKRLTSSTKRKLSIAHKSSQKAIAARAAVASLRVKQMNDALRGKKQPRTQIKRRIETMRRKAGGIRGLRRFKKELRYFLNRCKRCRMTQADFAKLVGVRATCICRIYNGTRFPKWKLLRKMKAKIVDFHKAQILFHQRELACDVRKCA